MIKDVFTLSKRGISARMMKWIWGFDPEDFQFFCNYFWLTLLNFIIFIPFSIIKLPILGYIKLINKASENHSKRKELKLKALKPQLIERIKNDDLEAFKLFVKHWYIYELIDHYAIGQDKINYFYGLWDKELAKKYRLEEEKTISQKQSRINRKVLIGKIATRIKWVSRVIGLAVLAVLYYYTILFIDYIVELPVWSKLSWNEVGYKLSILFWIFLFILNIILIIKFILLFADDLLDYLLENKKYNKFFNRLGKFLLVLSKPFIWLGKGLVYIWMVLVAIKQNNCPGIDWKD